MDQWQSSTLMDVVGEMPDPRHARGIRHRWPVLLTLIVAALVCGQRSGRAIGQWVDEHTLDVLPLLPGGSAPLPSTATLRRALRAIDVEALEARLARWNQSLDATTASPTTDTPWGGQAVDGKAVRGANMHGAHVHLVSLVQHGSGRIQAQVRVAAKSNEITAVPVLLAGMALQGTVTTLDSLLCQRTIAQHILNQQGHYLMVVKANQPALFEAIDLVFREPPRRLPTDYLATTITLTKGHGRLETRTLERTAALNTYLDWPGVGQVLRRTCERISLKTGEVSRNVMYGVTSLHPRDATTAQVEALWRGHWGVENKVHYVRDVTMGEDAAQLHVGHAPQALAALRNGILNLLRSQGVTQIADALRHHGASVHRAFTFIGALY